MKQSRFMSMLESIINIAVGFGISLGAQMLFLPMLGVAISFSQNLTFALIMTVISIVRSYLLRRVFEALHIRRPLSPFVQAGIAERFRQIEQEGWSIDHDDQHEPGELASAGACYAFNPSRRSAPFPSFPPASQPEVPLGWPWSKAWWKPTDDRRDLVKAFALIIAEGEKFDRARKSKRAA